MDNIFIGHKPHNSIWGKSCWDHSNISYNGDCGFYWIHIGIFGLDRHIYGNSVSICVYQGTDEYNELTKLIETKNNEIIEAYANKLIVKYGDPEDVYFYIEKVKKKQYKQGRKDAQNEMRKALGIVQSENTPYFLPDYD